ncbi:MAG TPA: glycosyltransferase family 4 protein [Methylomirabilota bacterium]|nr:glycosyltransferase family 4 protein [Methylomirabilota bacterium]
MRILALTNLYPPHFLGGYELICGAVVPALRLRGHDVHVLTSNHEVANAPKVREVKVERTLRIHGFYGHPWLNIFKLADLEAYNNRVLNETLDRVQPDLVYVWNMGGLSKSMLHTLQRRGIPTAFYLSDHWIARGLAADVWLRWWNTPEPTFPQRALRSFAAVTGLRDRFDKATPTTPITELKFPRVYFCSKALRQLTVDAGWDVGHGAVIYCPVNTALFDGEPKPVEAPLRKLLYVGRLAEDKGVMTALKAMRQVKGRFNGELTIFGRGDADYTAKLHAFVKEHQLPVTFASGQQSEMPRIYREHDGLLFTSEWAEPFALTPLEAMSSGLPVIGTTTGGSRELFRHRVNALTYTAGDADMLAARILELAGQPELRATIARTGHDEVRANYSESAIVDQIERYLTETLEVWPGAKRKAAPAELEPAAA